MTETDRQLSSVLHAVVVYAEGALCRRRAVLTLTAGTSGPVRVRLDGLPLTADPHSLRGSVLAGPDPASAAPAGLRVLDVRRVVAAGPTGPEDLSPLQQECDAAEEAVDAAEAARAALATQVEHIAALRAVPPPVRRGEPPRLAPTDALLALAEFVDARLAGLQQQLLAAEDVLLAARQRAEIARRRLSTASAAQRTGRPDRTTSVLLTLDQAAPLTADTEVGIEVEYGVPGATWTPTYHLRLHGIDGDAPTASLVMRACVAQQSGEDWNGVRLGLSTADLRRRTDTPELRSLRLGRRQAEAAPLLRREPPTGLSELFSGYDDFLPPGPAGTGGGFGSPSPAGPGGGDDMSWLEDEGDRGARKRHAARSGVGPGAGPMAVGGGGWSAADARGGAAFGDDEAGPAASGPFPQPAPPALRPPAMPTASRSARPPGPSGPPPGAYGAASASSDTLRKSGASPQQAITATHTSATALSGTLSPGAAAFGVAPSPAPAAHDYAQLALAGADESAAERGRLRLAAPPSGALAVELRRRAEAVAWLPLPPRCLPVRVSAGSFDHRYDAAPAVDVPSDGAWHTVTVLDFPVGCVPEHVCVPAVDPRVYAAVRLGNTGGHALLAGAAEVSVDGAYLMTIQLPTLAPGEQRRVGIGVVESIQVARRVRTKESSAGLRGGTTVIEHGIEIDLANRLARPVTVEVRERVPVSGDKDIRVDERSATPPWTAVPPKQDENHQRGMRVWRVALAPHARQRLNAGYEIRVPVAKAVFDGNRRP